MKTERPGDMVDRTQSDGTEYSDKREEEKFLVTCELGRLARWLRIAGLDASYERESDVPGTVMKALRQARTIVTRNRHFAEHPGVKCVILEANDCRAQLRELSKKKHLVLDQKRMFSRCVLCNVDLERIEKEKAKDKVPAYVYQTHLQFFRCRECERIYWEGSHWGNVKKIIEEL